MTTATLTAPAETTAPNYLAPPTHAAYHLTPDQVAAFDRDGFLVLRKRISGPLLAQLQAAGTAWVDEAIAFGQTHADAGRQKHDADGDFNFANRAGGKRVPFRVNYLHAKGNVASLVTLGSPEVLGIAESLAGRNFVPTYESMVFKMPGDGAIIPWHQDAVFQKRDYRIFNIDIYLDHAGPNSGALRVIPKSQTAIHDVCLMNDGNYDWAGGAHQIVDMEPGDVLIHDDMVLHGSPQTQNNPLRRVVYFEFRPAEQVVAEGPWDRSFIDQRMRLIPLALKHHARAIPDGERFAWNADTEFRPVPLADDAEELRTVHTVHTPGSYCSANS